MVKFRFLAQFSVEHLPRPVVSRLITYCIRFLYDWSFHLSYHITYICYSVVSYIFALIKLVFMAFFFCAAIRKDSVSLLRFLCLVKDFACLTLEISIQLFFFPFLFSDYFCSVDACLICIVSDHCNQSFSIILLLWEFFTPASADGLSLEIEWQQASLNL